MKTKNEIQRNMDGMVLALNGKLQGDHFLFSNDHAYFGAINALSWVLDIKCCYVCLVINKEFVEEGKCDGHSLSERQGTGKSTGMTRVVKK